MIKVREAIFKKGQIILEDLDLPDNTKLLIMFESNEQDKDQKSDLYPDLPEGIILDKKEGPINELKSFSENPVDFQRNIRENEWN